jgi:hypothetical protein
MSTETTVTTNPKTQSFTLTRALQQIKMYDSKIDKAITELTPVTLKEGNNSTVIKNFKGTEAEFITSAAAQLQSISDLRKNREIIKNALMKKNASTTVSIAGKEYTIVEAINKKANVSIDTQIVNKLINAVKNHENAMNSHNQTLQNRIDTTLQAQMGSSKQLPKDVIESTTKSMKDVSEMSIINLDTVLEQISTRKSDIDDFLSEVDICLSEINSITKIDVTLV